MYQIHQHTMTITVYRSRDREVPIVQRFHVSKLFGCRDARQVQPTSLVPMRMVISFFFKISEASASQPKHIVTMSGISVTVSLITLMLRRNKFKDKSLVRRYVYNIVPASNVSLRAVNSTVSRSILSIVESAMMRS